MKIQSKPILPLFLLIVILTACSGSSPAFETEPTKIMETALSNAGTALVETQMAIPMTVIMPTIVMPFEPTVMPSPTLGGWSYEYTATLPVTSVSNTSQKEIASLLFTQWLNHFKTEDADFDSRLEDFELIDVTIDKYELPIVQQKIVDFVAMVTFSVKPSSMLYWSAGNGISADNIWIRNKLLFVGVKQQNDLYSLLIMGTGP